MGSSPTCYSSVHSLSFHPVPGDTTESETWPDQLEAAYQTQPLFTVLNGIAPGSWQPKKSWWWSVLESNFSGTFWESVVFYRQITKCHFLCRAVPTIKAPVTNWIICGINKTRLLSFYWNPMFLASISDRLNDPARVAKLVDAADLKSAGHCGRAGSIPASGTIFINSLQLIKQ